MSDDLKQLYALDSVPSFDNVTDAWCESESPVRPENFSVVAEFQDLVSLFHQELVFLIHVNNFAAATKSGW